LSEKSKIGVIDFGIIGSGVDFYNDSLACEAFIHAEVAKPHLKLKTICETKTRQLPGRRFLERYAITGEQITGS
jgi:hypothetical protein